MKRQLAIRRKNQERGIALLFALLALVLLSAIAAGLIFMTDTDSAINSNFRSEQRAYFAARAGLEEGRIRMLVPGTAPGSTTPAGTGDLAAASYVPTLPPGNGGSFHASDMIYITNPNDVDSAGNGVKPWDTTNKYFDDELCHEYLQSAPYPNTAIPVPGVHCDPSSWNYGNGSTYYTQVNSNDPNTTTSAAMDYKWVRIMAKQNATSNDYTVDGQVASSSPTMPSTPTNTYKPICWSGNGEAVASTTCAAMTSSFGGSDAPVYQVTSLAVTQTGSRRMEQMEIAYDPPINLNSSVDSHGQVTLNGSISISGYDSCQCYCTGNTDSGNADNQATSCVPVTGYSGTCSTTGNGLTAVNGGAGSPPVNTKGSSGTVVGAGGAFNTTVGTWTYDVQSLVNDLSTWPTVVDRPTGTQTGVQWGATASAFCGKSTWTCPSPPALQYDTSQMTQPAPVNYVDATSADLHLSGGGYGSGIIAVNGNIVIDSGFQFYGLIIATGTVKFSGGGSAATNIYGGILSGDNTLDTTTVGGGVNIQFNSCAEKLGNSTQPPRILSFREVAY